ncbi:hypothetical protein H696_03006 [Fonticula alba]|uniref:Protein BCP1 n=1 Tax=Fonticula alba TaxID=691883 RepID=A0A058Z972_FONAL|nr:hypothetical protein H696_03006 [Fonticula alba]KCV70651.1 hypothetical protein H696_03006 [Fonticula alba]|eukprot:XP_009495167.1 hypothetical protein H696_03006 [Fonticula alba]
MAVNKRSREETTAQSAIAAEEAKNAASAAGSDSESEDEVELSTNSAAGILRQRSKQAAAAPSAPAGPPAPKRPRAEVEAILAPGAPAFDEDDEPIQPVPALRMPKPRGTFAPRPLVRNDIVQHPPSDDEAKDSSPDDGSSGDGELDSDVNFDSDDEGDDSDDDDDDDDGYVYDDNNEEETEAVRGEIVQVDFEFFNLLDADPASIRHLLSQVLERDSVDLFGLAEHICAVARDDPETTGSCIRVDGNPEPYACLALVNLGQMGGSVAATEPACLAQLRDYLAGRAPGASERASLQRLFDGKSALVVNERLINMPAQTAVPMFRMLADEVEAARRWSPDTSSYSVDRLVFVLKRYKQLPFDDPSESSGSENESAGPGAGTAAKRSMNPPEEYFFVNEEEEIVLEAVRQAGGLTFPFDLVKSTPRWTVEEQLIQHSRVLAVLPIDRLRPLVRKIEETFGVEHLDQSRPASDASSSSGSDDTSSEEESD